MLIFELKKQLKQFHDLIFNVFFFLITATIFVFAVDYDFSAQKTYAAGIILTILILAILTIVEKNLKEDAKDGVLEQLFLCDREVNKIILAKYSSFLIFVYLLLFLSPLILYSLALNLMEIKIFIYVVAAMLPLISALCFLGSIFTFKVANNKSFLVYLIVLPLLIPEIIFIMLTLKNMFITANYNEVINYLEYMFFVNLLLLPLVFLLARNSFKIALQND